MSNDSAALKLINGILSHGVDGLGPMSSSTELVQEYRSDSAYSSKSEIVTGMIRWETSKNFGSGFVAGCGGLITLPIAIPAALYATWFVQARLSGAIAHTYGHNVKSDRIRTFILLSLIGDSGKEILKQAGIQIGNKLAMNVVKQIPGKVLIEINKKIGFRLITKAGEKGVINLTKMIPIVGGFVGGGFDAFSTNAVGHIAKTIFKR